jgi:hypothetical protein
VIITFESPENAELTKRQKFRRKQKGLSTLKISRRSEPEPKNFLNTFLSKTLRGVLLKELKGNRVNDPTSRDLMEQ